MGPKDDGEAFLELFECVVIAGKWSGSERMLRLLPLLSGEAQLAQQLPADHMLDYNVLKRVILQRDTTLPNSYGVRSITTKNMNLIEATFDLAQDVLKKSHGFIMCRARGWCDVANILRFSHKCSFLGLVNTLS
ncbi:hypothetical protein HF521_012232 [Silurus meridionalis]|uniref:Uncharacterized protein n=1 Tax=Silurus meridionalis TaxID=175797 RepID=A0A8T0AGJ9_SILME|nr:hypothetical protein HF521_012232 [Silurus meridionalis]